ncbi:MAG: class I SAM-dependent methyltransferase [Anaerolineae bacterium]
MNLQELARAYDAVAEDYDRQVRGDEWMRWRLWEHYAHVFQAGHHVLDVGCGTGIDAAFLARRRVHVTGIDVSPEMIAQLRDKVVRQGLTAGVDAFVMDVAHLSTLPRGTFDGIISAFAGLNTTADLAPFAADAARLLRPGGRLILHLLNRFSLWEWLGLLARGEWAAARRLSQRTERTFVVGGQPVRHYLFSPSEAYRRYFASRFRLCRCYSLGVLRPPHTVQRLPSPIVETLGKLEQQLSSYRPFVNWGRFFVLDMTVRSEPRSDAEWRHAERVD